MNLVNHLQHHHSWRSNGRFGAGGRVAPEPQPGREIWMTGRGRSRKRMWWKFPAGRRKQQHWLPYWDFYRCFFLSDSDDIFLLKFGDWVIEHEFWDYEYWRISGSYHEGNGRSFWLASWGRLLMFFFRRLKDCSVGSKFVCHVRFLCSMKGWEIGGNIRHTKQLSVSIVELSDILVLKQHQDRIELVNAACHKLRIVSAGFWIRVLTVL